jgi:UDP-GlcNAc:undecaprenyl-phosphate/decaprenyl-phosphate GlcNAc-1-phosphate transferase
LYILAFVLGAALLASYVATPFVVRFAVSRGLFDDTAEARRVHTRPIPRLGGVAVCFAFLVGILSAATFEHFSAELVSRELHFLIGILVGGGVVFTAGLLDDLRGLSPLVKLAFQVVGAVIVFAFGFRVEAISVGSDAIHLGWFALPITVLWIVGVTNAFNLIDGLDGLATGVAIVALGTTLAVALALGNPEVAVAAAALLGALVGFLRYNFNPARIFLGDSGSLLVGFMLAVLAVHGSMKSATVVLVIVPLFALGLPIADTALAITRRWLRGVPLSSADGRHIHHRLLASGLSQRRAVLVMYAVSVTLAVVGISVALAPPTTVLLIATVGGGLTVVLFLYGVRFLAYHEFSEAGAVLAQGALRLRRIIQDQIHARDLIPLIERLQNMEQLEALLDEHGERFGFLGLEVCRENSSCREKIASFSVDSYHVWKLDRPVTPRRTADDEPYVLRIWCGDAPGQSRPYGAERVARVLGPAIERWLVQRVLPRPAGGSSSRRIQALEGFGGELGLELAMTTHATGDDHPSAVGRLGGVRPAVR